MTATSPTSPLVIDNDRVVAKAVTRPYAGNDSAQPNVPMAAVAFMSGTDVEAVAKPASPADPIPTYSPGGLLTVTGSLTRPANTTAYAIGDIVGAPIELVGVTRASGEAFRIERARVRKTSNVLTNAAFRLHLFRKPPVPNGGAVADNGVFDPGSGVLALADIDGYIGTIDVAMNYAATSGARGVGAPSVGSGITCETGAVVGKETSIWVIIEPRAAYVPASGETFYVTVEGARS